MPASGLHLLPAAAAAESTTRDSIVCEDPDSGPDVPVTPTRDSQGQEQDGRSHISREEICTLSLGSALIFPPPPYREKRKRGGEKKSEDPVAGIAGREASWQWRRNSREM